MEQLNWKMFAIPIIVLFVFIGGIIGIVNWQKSKVSDETPALMVNLSVEGETVTDKEKTVEGDTSPKDNKVFINGEEVAVGDEGRYSKTIVLTEGENIISIKAESTGGATTILQRTVVFKPNAAAPATPQPKKATTAPVVQPTEDLATSGPEDIIPALGITISIMALFLYIRSRKDLLGSLMR